MKKLMIIAAAAALAAFVFFTVLYFLNPFGVILSLAVTFGTIAYHFWMRLIVGYAVNAVMHNRADYTRGIYQLKPFERKLYSFLKVKVWKDKMPTFDADRFDSSVKSWDEIAQAMCQAEIVHKIIVVLSFVPLLFSIWFGDFPIFLITSILAALFDLMFVIMQRFNRPRVIRMIYIQKKRRGARAANPRN